MRRDSPENINGSYMRGFPCYLTFWRDAVTPVGKDWHVDDQRYTSRERRERERNPRLSTRISLALDVYCSSHAPVVVFED